MAGDRAGERDSDAEGGEVNVMTGKNTISGKKLGAYIGRIEVVNEQIKQFGEDRKVIFAELKQEGFSAKRVREVLKIRAMKPHDRQEAEAELDMYLHAIGLANEAPLFRAVGLMAVDIAAREQVIAALEQLVPQDGEIVLKIGAIPVRMWRDESGTTHHEDVKPEEPSMPSESKRSTMPPRPEREIPDVSQARAEELGREAYQANCPITDNPFPFGDKRQSKWDKGWREASGSDGMGPDTGGDD